MPPFTPIQLAALKRALRGAKASNYRLPEPAVTAVAAEAGLTKEQVRLWIKDVFVYYETAERLETFLSGTRVSLKLRFKLKTEEMQKTPLRSSLDI